MNELDYASINTAVRIRENDFLSKEFFDNLLKAKNFEQAQQLLKTTVYHQLTDDFEVALMDELSSAYSFVDDVTKGFPLTQIFSLQYSYHNLKVLLKNQLAAFDLTPSLIPIGAYSLDELTNLVKTETSENLPTIMVETVQEVSQEYREYGRFEAIDVLLDRRYFKHLVSTVATFEDEMLLNLVQAWADLYNLNCIFRLRDKKLSQAFLKSILSSEGQISVAELIKLATAQKFETILDLVGETSYGTIVAPLFDKEDNLNLSLELARDRMTNAYFEQARFEAFGYLPLLAYLYYKEMEVKNLRLILTGKVNGFDQAILKERMRPIYGL